MNIYDTNDETSLCTDITILSLHDALPIFQQHLARVPDTLEHLDAGLTRMSDTLERLLVALERLDAELARSEEHTSELQSRGQLVCRHLLEKKNIGSIRLKLLPRWRTRGSA